MHAQYEAEMISGIYNIKITSANPQSNRIPALYEIGGKTEAIADKYQIIDLRTLHKNIDGTACLCARPMERDFFPGDFNLLMYIEKLVVPYLFSLTFYEKYQRWPWGDYNHGLLGILEFYGENKPILSPEEIFEVRPSFLNDPIRSLCYKQIKRPSAKRSCLCGSTKRFKDCHQQAWYGAKHLSIELTRLGISPDHLF